MTKGRGSLQSPEGRLFAIAIVTDRGCRKNCAQCLTSLMRGIHCEYVRHRGDHETVFMGQEQTIQAIGQLCTIGHRYFLRMAVESVQSHAAEDRVAQRGHLLQLIPWRRFAPRLVPWAPLVDHEFYHVIRVFLAHDLPVTVDEALDAVALPQQFVPIHRVELQSFSFAFHPVVGATTAQVPRVMMERPAVNTTELRASLAGNLFEEATGP